MHLPSSRASKNRDSQERRVRPLIVRCCRVRKIQMSTYYTGRRAQRYNERWRTFSGKTLAEALAMIDVTALRNVPEHLGRPPRVLDVACGTGILLKELLERVPGIEVYGADASADMLVQARMALKGQQHMHLERVQIGTGETANLPYSQETFDLITLSLIHI